MTDKRPIDVYRDSALSATVGTPEEGAIKEMISLKEEMLIVKERAIYSMRLADQIDPERTNISLPKSVHQKLASLGTESDLVGKIILTANTLFKPVYLNAAVDCDACITSAVDIFKEMSALNDIAEQFAALQEEQIASLPEKQKSFHLPSIPDAEAQIKSFVSRAEHVVQKIYGMTLRFYGDELRKKSKFIDGLADAIHEQYGAEDGFSQFIDAARGFLKFVRKARHCVEHPEAGQRIIVSDFRLDPTGKIRQPTIEIVHAETPQPEMLISIFMAKLLENLLIIIESMIAQLCSKHMNQSGREQRVSQIPENMRRYKDVQFGYFMKLHGEWLLSS